MISDNFLGVRDDSNYSKIRAVGTILAFIVPLTAHLQPQRGPRYGKAESKEFVCGPGLPLWLPLASLSAAL